MKRVTVVITIGLIAFAIIGSISILQGNYAIAGSKHITSKHSSSKLSDSEQAYSTHDDDEQIKSVGKKTQAEQINPVGKKTQAEQINPEQAYNNLIGSKDLVGFKEINPTQSHLKINPLQSHLKTAKVVPISQSKTKLDPFSTIKIRIQQAKPLIAPVSSSSSGKISNPLIDKEEFDITVTNIKHNDILVSIAIDGLKNSSLIPGNPANVATPTSKVIVFKFDRHENAKTPSVLPIKLGDEYTACIAFAANKGDGSCLRAGVDSITQPQKKSLDANYIPL
jgi:hypothetical protein